MYSVLDLTIAIPAKNEERNLPGCLRSIGQGFAKKVVVIDSGSIDNTKEIAKAWGAEVIDFTWNGKFPKKRNWFLRTHTPSTEWILFLDADEYLTEDFKTEVQGMLNCSDKTGYWLNYTVYFLGKKLKGGYPLNKLALFKIGAGEYEEIEEERWSNLDMEVHEHPVINGKTGVIKNKIDHQDFGGITRFVIKHNEYASWEAARFLTQKKKNEDLRHWTWKQNLKYHVMHSVWFAPAFFLGNFILYGGFRDGVRGFLFAALRMSYYVQVYCKIKEIQQRAPTRVNPEFKSSKKILTAKAACENR